MATYPVWTQFIAASLRALSDPSCYPEVKSEAAKLFTNLGKYLESEKVTWNEVMEPKEKATA